MTSVYDRWLEFWSNKRWLIYTIFSLIFTSFFNYIQITESHKLIELFLSNGLGSMIVLFIVTPILQAVVILSGIFILWLLIAFILKLLSFIFP